ncbi:MerR family transcriptional regulator [Kinneretia asaccharophila]|uniref:MerR family transcriptional regulator n=1 Tax=Roseateles asaccharophilus TaxID=582607 RepID=A0A4R6NCT3_9BURK|nr:MerR family transcriptional regulator [Roseateles asaccharophilus]MDN3544799.1 MerR family transcriptional regulator [Roseateles asaccharophilus]TDP12815.1 MerR family transcriptional regulator [Roseateles asaccharophilus]
MSEAGLLIGELARRTGASVKALRLYESLGLIPAPRRRGSYRVYEPAHEEAVRFIRQAQAVGFRLQELQRLFFDHGPRPELGALLNAVRLKRQTLARERERLAHQDRLLLDCEAMLLSGRLEPLCEEFEREA